MAKKCVVNKETCIRCGVCTGICDDVFSFDDNGDVVNILGDTVPEQFEDAVNEAAASCPVQAIEIE